MKAIVRAGTRNFVGTFTFNKTLNLYKLVNPKATIYFPATSLNYVVEQPSQRKSTRTRKRKK